MRRSGRKGMRALILAPLLVAGTTTAGTGPAGAQGAPQPAPVLALELNALSQEGTACRLTFVAQNRMGRDLDSAVFETVLFTPEGAVERLMLFDFQALPADKPRVRQFDIAGADCAAIGRVLINDAHACSGDGIAPGDCIKALQLTTKTETEVLG